MKFIFNIVLIILLPFSCFSQQTSAFPHSTDEPFWISGQANFVFQANPPFHARYSGPNSFQPDYNKATSRVLSLYTGLRLSPMWEVQVHVEAAGGQGISQALGIAGFTNLDAVRNPSLGSRPYLARLMVHRVIPLGKQRSETEAGPFTILRDLPERRLDLRAGKFATVDFFDVNSVAGDCHLQFCNWSIAQNGAYDFAADTRGYTWGVVAELHEGNSTLRVGEMLMPRVANGMDFVWNLRQARSENFEYELHSRLLRNKPSAVRLLTFVNHANMGIYREALTRYESGTGPVPEISNHVWRTTAKYGFGVNLEQSLTTDLAVFARVGWNNGKTESFAFTEIDETLSTGLSVHGRRWRREYDRAGVAFATNGLSRDHRAYLAAGGRGFILGDGALNYRRENIAEVYYTTQIARGVYLSPALQAVDNPGYNHDRGPLAVASLRGHVEF